MGVWGAIANKMEASKKKSCFVFFLCVFCVCFFVCLLVFVCLFVCCCFFVFFFIFIIFFCLWGGGGAKITQASLKIIKWYVHTY